MSDQNWERTPFSNIRGGPRNLVLIISYLDYPFPSGLSRRIKGISRVLRTAGMKPVIISPIFRLAKPIPSSERETVSRIDLRFLRGFGPERLITKALANILFSLRVMVHVILWRRRILLLQYESIYSFPAGFLTKLISGLQCLGDDILPVPQGFPLPHAHLIPRIFSDAVTISEPRVTTDFLAQKVIEYPTGAFPVRTSFSKRRFRKKMALFVGTPTHFPNWLAVQNVVEASMHIPADPNVKFVVGGDFPKEKASQVIFAGKITERRLRQLYNSASIGLLPFFGTKPHGIKVKALEFLSNALLVISNREGVHGIQGLVPYQHYIPVESVEDLALKIQRYANLYSESARVANNGRSFVMRNYSWSRVSRNYLDYLRTLSGNQIVSVK